MIFSEHNVHPVVDEAAYKRFLRLPLRRALDGPLAENATWAREWFAAHARPWICAGEVRVEIAADGLQLAGRRLGDAALAARFAGATAAAIVAVSAGPELEAEVAARWEAGEPDRYFFLDAYAAAVVQALLAGAGGRLAACVAGRTVMPYYCPGYRGWPIGETAPVLAALEAAGALPGELETLESGMLRPKKSQLALLGLKPARDPEER